MSHCSCFVTQVIVAERNASVLAVILLIFNDKMFQLFRVICNIFLLVYFVNFVFFRMFGISSMSAEQ